MNAPEKATEIKGAVAAFLAMLTALWGWVGWAAVIWVGTMFIDYLSGTSAAMKSGQWSSGIARAGLWHKMGEVFAVLCAALCDTALTVIVQGSGIQLGFDVPAMVTPVVLLWYIITELGSIAENAGKLGAPVPKWLLRRLNNYKETIDHEEGGEDAETEYTGKHTNEGEGR